MNQVVWSALAMSGWIAAVFFLKFWSISRERLFLYFFFAFLVLALNWLGLAVVPSVAESRHKILLLRLLAFALIVVGVVDKNRRSRAEFGQNDTMD